MRSVALVLTLAFVFASSALLVGPASAQSSSTGSVAGHVCQAMPYWHGGYDNASMQGAMCDYHGNGNLPGAKVYLTRAAVLVPPSAPVNRSAETDGNGYFSFGNVAAGDYTLTATRTGFVTDSVKVTIDGGVATREDVALEAKDITVTGTVSKSSDGKPLSDAIVTACCTKQDGSQSEAKSGSDGTFSLKTKAGWQSLSVRRSGYVEQSLYELLDGSRQVPIRMEAIPPQDAKVHGVVKDQDGKPVPDVTVSVTNYGYCCYTYASEGDVAGSSYRHPGYSGNNWTQTDSQGRYAIHVYSGENQMQVYKEGYAGFSLNVRAASGEDVAQDLELKKFPEKTARIEGRVVDSRTGDGLRYASVSLQSPEFGLYECSVEEGYARPSPSDSPHETSPRESSGSTTWTDPSASGTTSTASGTATESSSGASVAYPYPHYYDPGCRIVVHPDGTFEGMVTPGYAIVSVYYDSYRSCGESHDADGSSSRTCGPEYTSWSGSFDLAPDATTEIDVPLRARPSPDATVSGYLVDSKTGKAIPNAQVSFSNEDRHGYGHATTDGDGSYSLRLRSGYHQVYVYAEGYLPWQGVLDVPRGETPFDVEVKPGHQSYGGCCYPYPYAHGADMAMSSPGTHAATATSAPDADSDGSEEAAAGGPSSGSDAGLVAMGAAFQSEQSGEATQYEDLGGGLGPYDAEERAKLLSGDEDEPLVDGPGGVDIPVPGLLAAALALLGVALLARRRLA